MADIIDMPSVPVAPSYAGILKGAGQVRAEAVSCDRLGTILFASAGFAAISAWGWAAWALVAWRTGAAVDVSPLAVVSVTLGGFGIFLLGWTMCGNFRRRAMTLRLSADLALAQRDVAINSYRVPVINVPAPAPIESPVAASRQRPLTPPAPRSTSSSTMLRAA
jgi:hypothetical protein